MTEKPYFIVLHGPNLNRLGVRRPDVYGTMTVSDIIDLVETVTKPHDIEVRSFQSNHEGALIDYLQSHAPECNGIIINPGALAHYGLALRDCLEDMARPTVEVHLSNVHQRESFRHQLVLAPVVLGQVVGLGVQGYVLAAQFLVSRYLPE